tara:strand:- start:870 stop:1292 length:423 start_codon:yes stop_codon:yes gene_type:complete
MALNYRKIYISVTLLIAMATVGCNSHAQTKDPEVMYDMASKLKDIAFEVQGLVKYGDGESLSNSELLLAAIDNDKSTLEIFGEYEISILVEGTRTALMLCDNKVALIEDSGCTPEVDAHYWNEDKIYSCDFKLELEKVCH